MDFQSKKYKYSVELIVDEIMKDAGIFDLSIPSSERFSPKDDVQKEIDNIVKFIKKRNQDLKSKGKKIDIKDFAADIYRRFQR